MVKTYNLKLDGESEGDNTIAIDHHLFLCRQVHGRVFTLPRRCRAKGCERGNNGDQDGKGCGLCQLVPDRVQGFENSLTKTLMSLVFKVGINYQPPTAVPGGDFAKVHRCGSVDPSVDPVWILVWAD